MKNIYRILYCFVFALTACSPTRIATPTLNPTATQTTPTPSRTLPPSATPPPTQTPLPPTITPLPTIPAFTPTFDVRRVVTVTPAAKAECPIEDTSLKLNFKFDDRTIDADEEILKFLNKGGSMKLIVNEFTKNRSRNFHFVDVTNDGQPDLIFVGFLLFSDTFYIYSCQNGQYVSFSGKNDLGEGGSRGQNIYEIVDMNKNGVPEIVAYSGACTGSGCYHFFIGEWDGKTFVDLGRQPGEDSIYLEGLHEREISIDDMNGDGFLDLKLIGGLHDYSFNRWRDETYIYSWDGTYFSQQSVEYAPPVYRFQAVQDADRAVLQHQYEKAFKLYQNAISSHSLKDYSPEIAENLSAFFEGRWLRAMSPTPPPNDPTEHPILAAYAYYRMIALHVHLGEMDAAQTQYATLQTKFPAGNPGHPYAEMASNFWDAYQSTGKMYNACAVAIAFADAHPEILIPLGSNYHGGQSHIYTPADVCPFR